MKNYRAEKLGKFCRDSLFRDRIYPEQSEGSHQIGTKPCITDPSAAHQDRFCRDSLFRDRIYPEQSEGSHQTGTKPCITDPSAAHQDRFCRESRQNLGKRLAVGLRCLVTFLVSLPIQGMADHRPLPSSSVKPSLKLEELLTEALFQNAELKAAKAETESSKAKAGPSGSYDDPVLGIEMMNYPVDTFSSRDYGMTGNQVSLSQKIPFPGKLGKRREAAEFDANAQEQTYKAKVLETIKQVKLTYYELFLTYRKLDTLQDQKGVLEQLTTVTRNNYALNKISQAEVLNLQVETAEIVDKTLEMERKIKGLLGELNHLLGRWDHSQFLYGRPESLKSQPFDSSKYPEKSLLDLAIERSPAIITRREASRAAESRLSYARRSYLPDFDFKLGYTFRASNAMDNGTDFVSGMVGISIPLWAGSKQSELVREAAAEKNKAEALFDGERNKLSHEIHVTLAKLEESAKRIQLYEGGVLPLTRQTVQSARSAYLTGKLEYSTLLGAINRRYQMEISYAEALANFHSKLAVLETTIGQPLGETP